MGSSYSQRGGASGGGGGISRNQAIRDPVLGRGGTRPTGLEVDSYCTVESGCPRCVPGG